jgi:hypothetical protein
MNTRRLPISLVHNGIVPAVDKAQRLTSVEMADRQTSQTLKRIVEFIGIIGTAGQSTENDIGGAVPGCGDGVLTTTAFRTRVGSTGDFIVL